MKALKPLVLVFPILGCCLFTLANTAAVLHRSSTMAMQWLGIILFVGSIVAIVSMNTQEPSNAKKERLAEDDDWNGPDGLSFVDACNTAGLSRYERSHFYEVARNHECWGKLVDTMNYARHWKETGQMPR